MDWTVGSVRVLLSSEGMPVNAKIEVLQGPNTNRQGIELYSDDGRNRPISYVLETPGQGSVVEITNTGPLEFPITASIVPHAPNQETYGRGAVLGGEGFGPRGPYDGPYGPGGGYGRYDPGPRFPYGPSVY